MVLCLLLSVVLVGNVICPNLSTTAPKEQFKESVSSNGSAQDTILPIESKFSVIKKKPGCISNDCKQRESITSETTPKMFVKKFKHLRTPPESLNFLATVPTLVKRPQKRPEQISIYHLNEKGDDHGWSMDYDFEVVQPDYKIDPENDHVIKEPLSENSEKPFRDGVSVVVEETDEDENDRDGISVVVEEIDEDENDLDSFLERQTKRSSIRSEIKSRTASTYSMGFVNNKNKSKDQDLRKSYIFKKSTQKPLKNNKMATVRRTLKVKENSSLPVSKNNRKPANFPFGFTPNLNKSFRLLPFSVYFSAKPIQHRNKLVVPYPYFVLKPNKSDSKYFNFELSDLNKTAVWIEGPAGPEERGFDLLPNLDLDFVDDVAKMENDEDYVPSTEEDDYVTFTIFSPTSQFSSESTVTATSEHSSSTTRFPFTVPSKKNKSTVNPNPYKNGSIYSYYYDECVNIVNASNNNGGVSTIPLLLLLFISFI